MTDSSCLHLFARSAALGSHAPPDPAPWPNRPGVCALADEHGRLLRIAEAASIRRQFARWLGLYSPQRPSADAGGNEASGPGRGASAAAPSPVPTGPRAPGEILREDARTACWCPAGSRFEAAIEYYRLVRAAFGARYRDTWRVSPCYWATIEPDSAAPFFSVFRCPAGTGEPHLADLPAITTFGPFFSRRDADQWVETVNDLFDLCRFPRELRVAPHGRACTYFEIGRCPAPCNGTVPMERFREHVRSAVEFAGGRAGAFIAEWEGRMRDRARRQDYEQAAALRRRLESAERLHSPAFAHVRPLSGFRYLSLQRSLRRGLLQPFLFAPGSVVPLEAIPPAEVAERARDWRQRLETMAVPSGDDPAAVDDLTALVASFLHSAARARGVLVHVSDLADPRVVDAAVQVTLRRSARR